MKKDLVNGDHTGRGCALIKVFGESATEEAQKRAASCGRGGDKKGVALL